MNPFQPKKGMTSIEAAQLYLREEQQRTALFDMDALERSGIARAVGFPFSVTIQRNRFICIDDTNGYKTTALYEQMDDHAIKRLVRALMRLKRNHDELKR